MLEAISSALASVITMLGTVVTALVGETGALKDLMPLLAIGIAISMFFVGVKALKGMIWGA